MNDTASSLHIRAAQLLSRADVFQALGYAALKARASRIAPEGIIRIGEFELIVAEDENGDGSVVQIILPAAGIEGQALEATCELDGQAGLWSDGERRAWLAGFWGSLAAYLEKWQQIRMRRGPGENITFEKAVSR
ncbi:MAG TPA: hypothetical protein PKK11_02015 [Methanothrix sp.]|nr:hypothetical protein [Methanothrix sp.]